eukprot:TRINITY_DN44994_c0_g1_i2.p1 TRINITY_DN44994_c0_g1~~TRINITY_DN44994_c0_g1_i2.p1  ORF type:complete len:419 (-),score=63.61 TRINITY_DN44994_c0_g1_i2:66-1322(-)
MYGLAFAASSGLAHVFMALDRLAVLVVAGTLSGTATRGALSGLLWSLGHAGGLLSMQLLAQLWPPLHGYLVLWSSTLMALLLLLVGARIHSWAPVRDKGGASLVSAAAVLPWIGKMLRRKEASLTSRRWPWHLCWLMLVPPPGENIVGEMFLLGMLQAVVCANGLLSSGWVGDPGTLKPMPQVLTFLVAAALASCTLGAAASGALQLAYLTKRGSPVQQRLALKMYASRFFVGFGLLWLCLSFGVRAYLESVVDAGKSSDPSCPEMYTFVTMDGSEHSLQTVPSWTAIASLDSWWGQADHLLAWWKPEKQPPFFVAASPLGGCGVFASRALEVGEVVGLAGVFGGPWDFGQRLHVTPWLGFGLNHCGGRPTAFLQRTENRLYVLPLRSLSFGEELLLNYDKEAEHFPIQPARESFFSC